MINNEILSFIKEQLAQGATKDKVKDMLVGQGGWDEKDVEEAFETISFSGTSYPSVLKSAVTDAVKSGEGNKSFSVSPVTRLQERSEPLVSATPVGAFTPASELMKAVSGGDVRPTVFSPVSSPIFSPGLSHVQQPKSMEPTAPGSSFSGGVVSRPSTISAEPMRVASENPRASDFVNNVGNNTGNNALSGLRARIASGMSGGGAVPVEPTSVFSPVVKEPMTYQAPPVVAPVIMGGPTLSSVAASFAGGDNVAPRQPSFSQGMGQAGGFSSMPSLNKAPMPSPQPQPMSVFPKGPIGIVGNPRISATPAQLAALQGQNQKKGGRFLLGLMMFIVGLVLGGVLMNAYMNGYIKTAMLAGVVDKGMNLIGLGTVVPPPAPEKAPTKVVIPSGGS